MAHDPMIRAWQLQLCANCACKHSSGYALDSLDLSWYDESVTIQLKSVLQRSIAWMLLNFVE